MDILNQFCLRLNRSEKPEAAIKRVRKRVNNFVKFSRREGYKVIVFIDKSISSRETERKWISRRIAELDSGRKKILVNSQIMIGNMFQSIGVPVHFSTIDCDDTIAAFAYHMNGSVLSQDADFFRYYVESSSETRPPYRVFSDFQMTGGRLSLKDHLGPKTGKPKASRKKILKTLPKTKENTFFLTDIPDYEEKPPDVDLQCVRGCGSNLTHETNPHLLARPLRQAVYWRMNYGPVLEKLAHWEPSTGANFLE